MIQPDDIRTKAEVLYGEFVQAWLAGDQGFFPKEIRGRKKPRTHDLAAANRAVRALREASKEIVGFGYTVKWREVNSRTFGRNQFPAQIVFETSEDLLRFLNRKNEFEAITKATSRLRCHFPILDQWIRRNTQAVLEIAPHVDGLLQVLHWFQEHPRPNVYVRELPLPIDTKFIERHQRVLREWFDLVLPSHTIRSDEDHFERRYGLRYAEPHLLVRFLDPTLHEDMGFPCPELSLPLHTVSKLAAPAATVFIVENKVNLLTLPHLDRAIAFGGLGSAVTLLRYVPWLQATPILYWGDIDVEGFMILSALRTLFPHVHSFLMDAGVLDRHTQLAVPGTCRKPETPPNLNEHEQSAFARCCDQNLRIEQERIPQSEVISEMLRLRTTNAAELVLS